MLALLQLESAAGPQRWIITATQAQPPCSANAIFNGNKIITGIVLALVRKKKGLPAPLVYVTTKEQRFL